MAKTLGLFIKNLGNLQYGCNGTNPVPVRLVTARTCGSDGMGVPGGYQLVGIIKLEDGQNPVLQVFDEAKRDEWGIIGFCTAFMATVSRNADSPLEYLKPHVTEPALHEGTVVYIHALRESEAAVAANSRGIRATKRGLHWNWTELGHLQEAGSIPA